MATWTIGNEGSIHPPDAVRDRRFAALELPPPGECRRVLVLREERDHVELAIRS